MDALSLATINKALDGLNQRYLYIAQNIANADTPDYQPVRVNFEDALREAQTGGASAVEALRPEVSVDAGGEGVRLDLELASASQTAGRYRTLLELLGRQMALHRAALVWGG